LLKEKEERELERKSKLLNSMDEAEYRLKKLEGQK